MVSSIADARHPVPLVRFIRGRNDYLASTYVNLLAE
jgi:hypothetical protein